MNESWEFDQPGRFTAGAIGDPGRRVFYFQAVSYTHLTLPTSDLV